MKPNNGRKQTPMLNEKYLTWALKYFKQWPQNLMLRVNSSYSSSRPFYLIIAYLCFSVDWLDYRISHTETFCYRSAGKESCFNLSLCEPFTHTYSNFKSCHWFKTITTSLWIMWNSTPPAKPSFVKSDNPILIMSSRPQNFKQNICVINWICTLKHLVAYLKIKILISCIMWD